MRRSSKAKVAVFNSDFLVTVRELGISRVVSASDSDSAVRVFKDLFCKDILDHFNFIVNEKVS